jgi:hypothetical protein
MIVPHVEVCPSNEHPEKSQRLGQILRCNDATQNCLKPNPNEEISPQIDFCRTPHRSARFSPAEDVIPFLRLISWWTQVCLSKVQNKQHARPFWLH